MIKKLKFLLKTLFICLILFIVIKLIMDKKLKNINYFGNFNKPFPHPTLSLKSDKDWYKDAIFYHIWVKSFYDSNGDGIGDLNGITIKLDYLSKLGINCIYLSPIFDCYNKGKNMHGYDTIDYYKINPLFGTEDDLLNLINEAHKKGIRIIFDFVLNHTSNKHPWFINSKNNGDKRDWYIWSKDPIKNNEKWKIPWLSDSNWTDVWHKEGDYFYYGLFGKNMPDLNLKNLKTREAIANILIYWLDKGFDGVRIDASRYLIENNWNEVEDTKETHEFIKNLRKEILSIYEKLGYTKILIAETWTSSENISNYYGNGFDEYHLCFDFPLTYAIADAIKNGYKYPSKINSLHNIIKFIHNKYPPNAHPAIFLSNHDNVVSRPMTEYDGDKNKAILAFALSLFIKGSNFIYYGNEIGMTDGEGLTGDQRFRTSFDWNLLKIEIAEKNSIFNIYKKLILLKKTYKSLRIGNYKKLNSSSPLIFSFLRYYENEYILIIVNFSFRKIKAKISYHSKLDNNLKYKFISLTEDNKIYIIENEKDFYVDELDSFSFKIFKIEKIN